MAISLGVYPIFRHTRIAPIDLHLLAILMRKSDLIIKHLGKFSDLFKDKFNGELKVYEMEQMLIISAFYVDTERVKHI